MGLDGDVRMTTAADNWPMAPSPGRSAALLISVYVDVHGGAPWYARLQGFDDPGAPELRSERVSDKAQLCRAVGRWLEGVLDEE